MLVNHKKVNSSSYYLTLYIKSRKKVFDQTISDRCKMIFEDIGAQYHIDINHWCTEQDHLFININVQTFGNVADFVEDFKVSSSKILKKEFPQLKRKFWKTNLWEKDFHLTPVKGYHCSIRTKF
ncbi:IS200/IS605 family transposase [Desertibacillus haloalkaliphilus]|uniref:IS200/IS605 family transposase n=1 Tax=Desertibacillus haloalkaliphilus TaxID=1328930 RepID=UPI001C2644F7|nr:IS200/IS605 family transposase [Desertibacillus haloalkaliphilus]MBU8906309.1 IS200/IS605 family transposase [Desertibacillus haloalkaliphilus]